MSDITRSDITLRDLTDLGDDIHSVTIFANELSRDGVIVDPDGMDFSSYEKNPVVLYAHDFAGRTESGGLPIGRTLRLVRTADGHIRADFEFITGDPFAERVRNAWDQGFLRGASIAWRAIESSPTSRGLRVVRSELLEWSIVAVPADPDALRDSYRRIITALLEDSRRSDTRADRVIFDHGQESGARHQESGDESGFAETRRLLAELRHALVPADEE